MESANRYLQEWLSQSDPETRAALIFDIQHQAAHDGRLFNAGYTFPVIANAGTARYVVTTGAAQPNFNFSVHAGGAMRIYFYEGSTYTGGTALPAYNANRLSSGTPTLHAYHSPTAGTAGTVALIDGRYLTGGENPTTRVGGGLASGEILLGTAQNYMLDVVNVSGGNAVVSVVFEWYEQSV